MTQFATSVTLIQYGSQTNCSALYQSSMWQYRVSQTNVDRRAERGEGLCGTEFRFSNFSY